MSHFSPEVGAPKSGRPMRSNRWRVILYNNDRHRFDDVVKWLEAATGCEPEFAIRICHVCEDQGRAVCYQGAKDICHQVSAYLRRQGLQVEVDDY